MKHLLSGLALLAVAAVAQAGDVLSLPPLDTYGFVSGRAATEADVSAGDAVFLFKEDGLIIGQPLDIQVPQYAVFRGSNEAASGYVIIVQAEQAAGIPVVAARFFSDGKVVTGTPEEFTLLGDMGQPLEQ
ncbi:hypothetical protein F1529_01415 [Alcanivorax sp. VBW004]|uniref:hypothetical protein n=1 Tax=Alcanivorax sp. VBW004 TaxID=1287708 RepID=UPI0012BC4703|nr:hypothetical protein [Alcanivorax sp. VBW004]MTT51132.1 hypothetical protein [Alcanivorax sp. VBW004]